MGHDVPLCTSKLRVRFGSGPTKSLGTAIISMRLHSTTVYIDADVVKKNVTLLIGLEVFDRLKMTPNVVENVLVPSPLVQNSSV